MPDNNSELAYSSPEPSHELKAAARCAEILFILAFVLAIATLSLNRALSENRLEYRARYEWYDDSGSMLGRMRAFRERSPAFYEGLVLSSLTHWPPREELTTHYPSIAAIVAHGPVNISRRPDNGRVSHYGPSADNTLLSELISSAQKFGGQAARIVADEPDPARRRTLLNAAVAATFENAEARQFLQATAVVPLSRIDLISEWTVHTRSMWVVYGEWPPVGGSRIKTAPGTTYTGRFIGPPEADAERSFLYQHLAGMPDPDESEKALVAVWHEAFERVKNTPTGDPQIALPGGSMSLRATDIVMLGGPLLVILQAFFALFWIRYWKRQPKEHEARTPFMFPTFESPVDPLDAPMPRSMDGVTQRVVWILFLVIPAFVLSFAIVTRYDLSVFTMDWRPRGDPWFARILDQRGSDGISLLLDTINIISLLFSTMFIVQITTSNHPPDTAKSGPLFVRWVTLFAALLLSLALWLWSARHGKFDTSVGLLQLPALLYWISFGLTWLIAMLVSFSYRSRLVFVVSFIGLVFVLGGLAPS